MIPMSPDEALDLVIKLGGTPRLLKHIELVMEAADRVIGRLNFLQLHHVRQSLVRVLVIFHDVGKVVHPDELEGGGSLHEEAGLALLLKHGIPRHLARISVTHARWQDTPDVTFPELIVALADRLWKGHRDPELELAIISALAGYSAAWSRWDLFIPLDTLFESIAAGGHDRLERSRI
jgi:hypothetical protein